MWKSKEGDVCLIVKVEIRIFISNLFISRIMSISSVIAPDSIDRKRGVAKYRFDDYSMSVEYVPSLNSIAFFVV